MQVSVRPIWLANEKPGSGVGDSCVDETSS